MDSRRKRTAGLGLAALLAASPASAQLVSSEEAQARRQCIDEAGRRGWNVEEVGEGDYRFGNQGFVWMTWQCRVNTRSGMVAGTRYVPHAGSTTRRLACESRDGQPRTCTARVAGGVRLPRRTSSARCDEGRSWWWTLDGVTVTEGCRAEFEYREQGREL
jgi:hypothetical protein